MKNKMKSVLAFCLVLSLLLAVGCAAPAPKNGSDATTANAAEQPADASQSGEAQDAAQPADKDQALTKVSIVLDWTENTNHTGLFVARDLGYYKEAGLDVNIVKAPEDGAEALVGAGRADFGISFQDFLANSWTADQPLPVTALAAIISHNSSGLLSLASENITRPKDLEGKKYATWDLPVEQATIKNVMEKDGGDFSKLKMIPYTMDDAIAGLASKQVDVVWVYYAWDGMAAKVKELKTNFINFAKINPDLDFYSPVIIGNNDFIAKHPETVKAFMAATAKGYKYAMENPDKAAEILVKAAPGLDIKLVKASQEWLKNEYQADAPYWGYIDKARWDRFYSWLADNKLMPKRLPSGFGFTNEFLPQK